MQQSTPLDRVLTSSCVLALFLAGTNLFSGSPTSNDETDDPNQIHSTALYSGLDYRMIGPYRGGRVTAVTGVADEPGTFYMGSTGGGVWKTSNYGLRWDNISDEYFEVASIGSIDVADSDRNVIYVGTGSAGIRSNVSTGRGVYKSTDAGKTWTFIGLRDTGQIGDVVVHPRDPDLVYVAALGHAFGPNPDRGVYRSKDGGANWERVLYVSERTGAVTLGLNPANPREIYAGMWTGERKPWTIISGSLEGGIYKTKDGGDSWSKLENGLPDGLVGKSSLSVSPANPDRVYALVEAGNKKGGLYRSDDAGENFRRVSSQLSLLYRPFYYTQVDAHPTDEDTVFVNNEGFFKSTNGGKHFERISTPHGDNHDIWINPHNPDIFVQSNDGGANVTTDGGASWSTQYNQPTAELYQVAVDSRFPYRVYGAQQDNSTITVPSNVSVRPLDPKQNWYAVSGCETGPVVPHPNDPDIVYGGCKGRHSRFNLRTGQVQQFWVYPHFNYGHKASDMPFRFQRVAPMIVSPHDPNVIYHTSHVVHRSTDEGRNWEVISPDLTANEPDKQGYSGGPITRDITGEEIYSAIYVIAESPDQQGELWVGSNDGPLHISRDGGQNWKEITPDGLAKGGRVNRIDISKHRPGKAYAAIYRYLLDDWAPYIYRTLDYGESWELMTSGGNGVPADHPTRVVREDPEREGLLYAGTEFGMFVSFDDGSHWQSLQLDMPATPITDILVHNGDLVISTKGRSFWILDDITPLHQINTETASAKRVLYKPRDAHRARWAGSLENRFPGFSPQYLPTGALIHYYLADDSEEQVRLEILSDSGEVIREFKSSQEGADTSTEAGMRFPERGRDASRDLRTTAGMHRFVWDLQYPGRLREDGEERDSRGPMAVPGRYQVRLTIGEWTRTEAFSVLIDPRVAEDGVTQQDLEAQLAFNLRIRDASDKARLSIKKIQSVREQLEILGKNAKRAGIDGVEEESAAISKELYATEGLLVQTEKGKVGAQLEPQLIGQLNYLYSMTNPADQAPPADAVKRLDDIEQELEGYLEEMQASLNKVDSLNARLKREGVAAVIVGGD